MTKIIVVSDSHNNRQGLEKLHDLFAENDAIIHLGDVSADGNYLKTAYPHQQVTVINGNCDPVKLGENECVLEIEGVKLFLTHGHLYGVKYSLDKLCYRAQELGCTVALYGHTHNARIDQVGNVTAINPGCMSRYSQNGYCYLCIHQGKVVPTLVSLN